MSKRKLNKSSKQIATSALLAILIFIATIIIKIPTPFKGYINLGDSIILMSAMILSPLHGFFASGIGAGLADFVSGYALYAPATFIIKGIVSIVAYYSFSFLSKKFSKKSAYILSGVLSEICMIFGYFIFEVLLYEVKIAIFNALANFVQAVMGITVGTFFIQLSEKYRLF